MISTHRYWDLSSSFMNMMNTYVHMYNKYIHALPYCLVALTYLFLHADCLRTLHANEHARAMSRLAVAML